MLYYPWRDKDVDLKGNFPSFKDHFQHVQDRVRTNKAMFNKNAEEIDRAYDDLERIGPPEDVWDTIAPNVEYQQAQQEDQGILREGVAGRE